MGNYKRNYRKKGTMTRYKRKDNFTATADFARQGYYLAKRLARVVNVEVKNHDVVTSLGVPATGIVHDLSVIAAGTTNNTRDGSGIKVMSLNLRGHIQIHASSVASSFRIILFRGKNENEIAPTVSTVLQAADVNSFKNEDNKFQTKILIDQTIQVGSQTSSRRKHVRFNEKLFGHINYSAATTDIESGGVYLLLISTEASNTPTFAYTSRLTYVDN